MKNNQIVICAIFCFGLLVLTRSMQSSTIQKEIDEALFDFARKGDLKGVTGIIEEDFANVNSIHIESLLSKKASITVLDIAAYHGYYDIVTYLIDQGAKIKHTSADRVRIGQYTALLCAVMGNNYDVVQFLLEYNAKADVNDKVELFEPMMYAISNQQYLMLKLLLQYNNDLNQMNVVSDRNFFNNFQCQTLDNKMTILMYAVIKNNIIAVLQILKAGADVNFQILCNFPNGFCMATALDFAILNENVLVSLPLLQYQAQSFCCCNMPRFNFFCTNLQTMNSADKERITLNAFTQILMENIRLKNSANIEFLLQEGLKIPDELDEKKQQLLFLDSVIIKMNERDPRLNYPLATTRYKERLNTKIMKIDFATAVLIGDVNGVKKILDQGLTQEKVATLEIISNQTLMKYVIKNKLENIMYELLRHGFMVKNDNSLFSEYKVERDEEKKWVKSIIERVNNEKNL